VKDKAWLLLFEYLLSVRLRQTKSPICYSVCTYITRFLTPLRSPSLTAQHTHRQCLDHFWMHNGISKTFPSSQRIQWSRSEPDVVSMTRSRESCV
jgi:hypothetical protein